MAGQVRTTFSELTREAAIAILERNCVGRIAYSFHDRVDIEPISYVYHAGWLYARTSPGMKLATVKHHPWVAFEVDEIEGRTNWRSVVVRGTIYFFNEQTSASERAEYEAAVAVLRSVDPDAMTEADLVPHRSVVFRIHVDDVTARAATPG